jgi:cytochrome c peroxidase
MSLNNTVSCATCHQQSNAFADASSKSVGFESTTTRRNSPAIINASSKASFFWDGRSKSLEEMVLMPVQHNLEMGMEKLDVMEKKIASVSYYPALFKKAFGTEDVTRQRISFALAQFVRALRSQNSRMDMGQLTSTELEGQHAFSKFNCSGCHAGPDLGGDLLGINYYGTSLIPNSANIGLDMEYEDKGLAELNGNPVASGAFMIPSLRNIDFTAPYMHDGRYNTLEEVIEHYNSGIQPNIALDHVLIDPVTNTPVRMNMTDNEKTALIAYLKACSDRTLTTDVRFSNPFK